MCIRDSATTELRLVTDNYLAFGGAARADSPAAMRPDSLGGRWYSEEYQALYGRLTAAIKSYMTSTQSSLVPRAEQMKKNAYRAVTPVLISLAVMIAIVLMLFYFMSIYCCLLYTSRHALFDDRLLAAAVGDQRGDRDDF